MLRALCLLASVIAIVAAQAVRREEPNPTGKSIAIQRRANLPARIVEFKAQAASIQAGASTMLIWAVENPNSVRIEPEVGPVASRGSRLVRPAITTTYTLTASGDGGAETRTVTIIVAGASPAGASGTGNAPARTKEVPRMPDGKPNLSGIYNGGNGHAVFAPMPAIQLQPGAERFRVVPGPNSLGPWADCLPAAVPAVFGVTFEWEIVQGVDRLVILYDFPPSSNRVIPTDGRPHPVDPDPTWTGDSVGHWEGDTLVVDTVSFNDKTVLFNHRHTESLHVVERFSRPTPDAIQYQATVEDPNVFRVPHIITATFPLRADLEKIDEFVCENKHDYSQFFEQK
jgi:hypothetical protein